MPKVTLTAKNVTSLKAEPGKPQTDYTDKLVAGLVLRVFPSGARTFLLFYRPNRGARKGKLTRMALGRLSEDFTLADARSVAKDHRAAIRDRGADPAVDRKDAEPEAVETYEAVVDRFIRQYAKPRQRTWKETERVLKAAPWKGRAFSDITSKDADKYLSGLVEAGKPYAAKNALSWLKTCWRWARRRHIVDVPIMDVLLAEDFGIVTKARERVYTDDEIKALWNATGADMTARERGFLKLSILLGVRAGALTKMRKSELDDRENPTLWTIPTPQTKTRKSQEHKGRVYLVPISPLARRVLLPLLKGDGDMVFPSAKRRGATMDCGTPLYTKIRKASGVTDFYQHACRDTITTNLQNWGHDKYDRSLVLQHSGAGTVTDDYSHGYSLDRARELLEKWASHVAEAVAGEGVELAG